MSRIRLSPALLAVLALAAPARADLPKSFDWSDEAIWANARSNPAAFAPASPKERAKLINTLLMGPDQPASFPAEPKPGQLLTRANAAMTLLEQASDVERFETLRTLDRSNDVNVRQIYEALDRPGQARLLALTKSAGDAGTRAGLQQLGVVSDNDDTAFPTQFKPDGPIGFKGAADFYKLLVRGTDGKGDPANMHYVSARPPLLGLNSRIRLAAAGLPKGTFDFQTNPIDGFKGLDGIEHSKEKNLDLWMKLHPGQRFVLLGDTIQRDPEVYRWALANHPDQAELVLIHGAGGPERKPEDYRGEVFFDDSAQAKDVVTKLGIPQPGAKLPAAIDATGLPLPRTDVSAIKDDHFPKSAYDFVEETGLSTGKVAIVDPIRKLFGLIRHTKKTADAAPVTPGMTSTLGKVGDGR